MLDLLTPIIVPAWWLPATAVASLVFGLTGGLLAGLVLGGAAFGIITRHH